MTERALWIEHGKVVSDGETASVLLEYGKAMERREAPDEDPGRKVRSAS